MRHQALLFLMAALVTLINLPLQEVAARSSKSSRASKRSRTKPAAKPSPLTDPQIEALFDAKQGDIRECALQRAIYKGAKSVELTARVLVGRDGRVFGAQVKAVVDGGDGPGVESCVSEVIQTIVFPSGTSALRELLRNWRFAIAEPPVPLSTDRPPPPAPTGR